MQLRATQFVGGSTGLWTVEVIAPVTGVGLPLVERVAVIEEGAVDGAERVVADATWRLRGVASYERYVTRREKNALTPTQPPLGRPEADCAALIPVLKSSEWWALAHDERRAILEDRSQHIQTGLRYLPAVARRLYQSRDLGEPFDFLTWFEYAPSDGEAFEELVQRLRHTEEWQYVEREIDIRLRRAAG